MRKNKYMRHRAEIRKCLAIGLTAAMCMAMLAGCSTSQSTSSTSDTEVTSDVSTETDADKESPNGSADAENTSVKTEMTVEEMQAAIDEAMSDAAIDITDMFTKRDLAGNYDESEAVKITLSGKTAACNSSNVQIEDGVVTIKAAGVYVLSGTFTDGTIVVDAGDDDKVQLVLDGVSITAADYAAIYAKNADKVFVTLAEGAGNSLTVSGDYVQTDDNNVDAVIFAKCDLTLNGTGSLTVKDNTGHGIVSKDDLVVTGGTYTIYSQDHCLNGKDSVRIADGTFNLSCDEDGIHAGNDDQQDGYVYIEGGDINISVGDDALHAGEADAELVLQQLTHAADAAVAQMVDIIGGTNAVAQTVQVVDGGQDVLHGDGAADQLVVVAAEHFLLLLHIGGGVEDLLDLIKGAALVDAALLHVEGEEALCVHTAVGDDLDLLGLFLQGVLHLQHDQVHTGVVGLLSHLAGDLGIGLDQHFAGQRVHHVLSGHKADDAAGQRQLLVHLVTAEPGQIVTARVEEQHVDLAGSGLHRGRLAGAQLAVNFQQALVLVLGGILFQGSQDALVVTEEVQDVLVGGQAQCTAQHGDGQLAVLIDTDIEHVGGIGLILQPCTAVGIHGCAVQVVAHLIFGISVEYAGRTAQLADDGTLRAVDHKGARIGHQREVAHENFLVLDLAGLLVQQTGSHAQGGSVGHVALLALLDAVLGLLIQTEVHETQRQVTGVVLNGADVVEDLFQALVQEPLIRVLLDLDQVRHTDDFVDVGEAHALGFAELDGLDFHHKINHSLLLYSTGCRIHGSNLSRHT